MTEKQTAIVTGANRGIGFEICRQLAQKGVRVILTARDPEKGQRAHDVLADKSDVLFHQLDVTRSESIRELGVFVRNTVGRCDILVNNAAIYIDHGKMALNVDVDTMKNTLETNFLGPLQLCQSIIPLMQERHYGRIVNLSSGMGAFDEMHGGYPSYRISKTALNAMTVILASELRSSNILVNAMCPGWVRTDMGGASATRSVAEGADTAIWLAMLPDGGPSGKFFRDRREISW